MKTPSSNASLISIAIDAEVLEILRWELSNLVPESVSKVFLEKLCMLCRDDESYFYFDTVPGAAQFLAEING